MRVPERFWGLRWLTVLVVGYGLVWGAFEGDLRRVVILSVGATAVALGHLWQRTLGGRTISRGRWLLVTAVAGILCGLSTVVFTLLFMGLKTGLHAHGPEFTSAELLWVWQQLPLWLLVGLISGLGIGLVILAMQAPAKPNT